MIAYYVSTNTFYVTGLYTDFTEGRKFVSVYPGNTEVTNTIAGYTLDSDNNRTDVYVKENNLENSLSEVKLAIVSNKSLPDHAGQADEATTLISDRELHYWTLIQASKYSYCTFTLLDSVDNSAKVMSPQIINQNNRPQFDFINKTFVFEDNTSFLTIDFPALTDQTYSVFLISPLINTTSATLSIQYSIDDGVTWISTSPFIDIKVQLQKLRVRLSRNSGTLDNIVIKGLGILYNPTNLSENAVSDVVYTNKLVMEDVETFDSYELTIKDGVLDISLIG